jgi:hypothetical protein
MQIQCHPKVLSIQFVSSHIRVGIIKTIDKILSSELMIGAKTFKLSQCHMQLHINMLEKIAVNKLRNVAVTLFIV